MDNELVELFNKFQNGVLDEAEFIEALEAMKENAYENGYNDGYDNGYDEAEAIFSGGD